MVIRRYRPADFEAVLAVINDAAHVYRDVLPPALCPTPYMAADTLRAEIAAGVVFWVYAEGARPPVGVMGLQEVEDVALIRHAYVRPDRQGRGIGGLLLGRLQARAGRPVLVGTWAAATWAIRFYERRGFGLVPPETADRLLQRYWTVPAAQRAASVVLADTAWFARPRPSATGSGQ